MTNASRVRATPRQRGEKEAIRGAKSSLCRAIVDSFGGAWKAKGQS